MNFFTNISQNARVHIIYLTFNRLYYTKKTLPALLNSSKLASYKIRIVDNGSNDGTVEYLQQLTHPRIEQVIYNKKNQGLVKPTKKFWKESNAELIGKIDNDILVPKGWLDKLIDAHQKIPELGVIGYCHFREEDFKLDLIKSKVLKKNGIYLRQQPWIGGNYILKREMVMKITGYRQSRKLFQKRILYGFTKYQEKLAEKGYMHGYLCNEEKKLYLWELLDDPRHPYFHINNEYSTIRSMSTSDIINWYKKDAKQLLENY